MAGESGLTQLSGSIQDMVRSEALDALYDKANLLGAVNNVTKDILDGSDRVSIPIVPSLTVRDVGTDTGQINSGQADTITISSSEVTVDRFKAVVFEMPMHAVQQAKFDVLRSVARGMGDALGDDLNVGITAEHSNITGQTDQGDSGGASPLDDAVVRGGIFQLDEDDVPDSNRSFILHYAAESHLLALARFSEAQNTGFGNGLQIKSGRIESLYGYPVHKSSSVASSGGALKNLFVHKNCIGVAIQRNFKVFKGDGIANFKLTNILIGNMNSAVDVIRNNHGVILNSATTV